MPKHLRIAEILQPSVNHRIPRKFCPRRPAVFAVREVLRLFLRRGPRVNRYQAPRRLLPGGPAQPARVLLVFHRRPAEYPNPVLFGKRHRKLLPMDQVRRHGMTPAHVPPLATKWIELKKHLVLPIQQNRPIGIIDPVRRSIKVNLRLPLRTPCRRHAAWRLLGNILSRKQQCRCQ